MDAKVRGEQIKGQEGYSRIEEDGLESACGLGMLAKATGIHAQKDIRIPPMKIEDFFKNREEQYFFRLSKLMKGFEKDSGLVVELMRSATHILAIRKIMSLLLRSEQDVQSSNAGVISVPESEGIFMLNLSVAQLREAMKLLGEFAKSNSYQELYKNLDSNQKSVADGLVSVGEGFHREDGILKVTMVPLRKVFYHYLASEAADWFSKNLVAEGGGKPPYFTVDLSELFFEPGADYDKNIFYEFIFLGTKQTGRITPTQSEIVHLQKSYLVFVRDIVDALLKQQGISKGWKGFP